MTFLLRLALGLVAFLTWIPICAASADGAAVLLTGLTVGFNGCYKNGSLTPVLVRFTADALEGRSVRAILESQDPDGTPTCWEKTVSVRQGENSVSFLFTSGRENASLSVRLFSSDDELLAERTFKPEGVPPALRKGENAAVDDFLFPKPIGAQRPIWLLVGGGEGSVTQMLSSLQLPAERVPVPVPVARLSDLPDRPDGLDAADLVILNTSDRSAYDGAQGAAAVLKKWLFLGGKTVLFGSPETPDLLTPGGPLADFLPGTIRSSRPAELRAAPSLVRFVPKAKNLVMLGSLDSPYLRFPLISSLESGARILLGEEGMPLLVCRPVGFGMSLFFAPDPETAPLADWNGRTGLLMKILDSEVQRLTAPSGRSGLIRLGYGDLSGQIRSALDRFDGIRPLPFSAVFALMVLFVAVIGPVDWFLTHRLFSRPYLTWITLPIWLVLFVLLTVWLGGRFRSRQYRINLAEMTDIDAETGFVRGTLWGGVYAPEDARFDLSAHTLLTGLSGTETELTWLGLSGSGLGGISSPIRSFAAPSQRYTLDGALIRGFSVPIRSTRSLSARWHASRDAVPIRLTALDGRLSGTLVNPFDDPMKDAVLLYGGHAWFLGTLPPGETPFDPAAPKTDELQRVLTGSSGPLNLKQEGSGDFSVWERFSDTSADLCAILRVSGFYRLAGGRSLLGLGNEGMVRLDGSDALDADRAILFASSDGGGASLELNLDHKQVVETNRRGTIVRIWIPVDHPDGELAGRTP